MVNVLDSFFSSISLTLFSLTFFFLSFVSASFLFFLREEGNFRLSQLLFRGRLGRDVGERRKGSR